MAIEDKEFEIIVKEENTRNELMDKRTIKRHIF